MWPNPRIPFQMSSERARLEPPRRQAADGQCGGQHRVLALRPADAARHTAAAARGPDRAARPAQLLLGRVRHALRHAAPVRHAGAARHQGVGLHQCAVRRRLSLARQGHGGCGLGARRARLVPALAQAGRGRGGGDQDAASPGSSKLSGKKVRGWFGAGGGESMHTPDILKRCGVEFTHDWLVDDLPCWMTTAARPAALPALHVRAQRRADLGGAGPIERRAPEAAGGDACRAGARSGEAAARPHACHASPRPGRAPPRLLPGEGARRRWRSGATRYS